MKSQQQDYVKDGIQYDEREGDLYDGTAATSVRSSTPQIITTSATFEGTTSAEESDGIDGKRLITHKYNDEIDSDSDDDDDDDDIIVEGYDSKQHDDDDRHPSFRRSSTRIETFDCRLFSSRKDIISHILYITTFAILGTICRIYIGRFFGFDCILKEQQQQEQNENGTNIDISYTDFLSPLSSQICLTSDGKTQRGGAIFIDLPANMLGSYVFS
jgi:hypothetical protein